MSDSHGYIEKVPTDDKANNPEKHQDFHKDRIRRSQTYYKNQKKKKIFKVALSIVYNSKHQIPKLKPN